MATLCGEQDSDQTTHKFGLSRVFAGRAVSFFICCVEVHMDYDMFYRHKEYVYLGGKELLNPAEFKT